MSKPFEPFTIALHIDSPEKLYTLWKRFNAGRSQVGISSGKYRDTRPEWLTLESKRIEYGVLK